MEIPNTSRTIPSKYGNIHLGNISVTVVSIKGVTKNTKDLTLEERNIVLNSFKQGTLF